MRVNGLLLGFVTIGLFVSAASAQLIVNPIGKLPANKIEVGVSAAFTAMDYSISGRDRTVYRGTTGASFSKAVDESSDICGSVNLLGISDAEGSDVDSEVGYQLSFGGRWHVFERGLGAVVVYGLGHYLFEKYTVERQPRKMFVFEATGGAVGSYAFHPDVTAYVGAELVAYSDGEMRGIPNPDVEREGYVTVRGGAVYELNKYFIRAELAVGSERGLLVGVSRAF